MKKIIAAALLTTVFAAPASATDQGYYAFAETGKAGYSASFWPTPGTVTFGGGYHFNQNFGLEAGYTMIGDSKVTTIYTNHTSTEILKTSITHLAAIGTLPLSDSIELFMKLGVSSEKIDYTYSDTIYASASASGTKTGLTYGLGGQFNISPKFGIRVQYQDFGKATLSPCTANCTIGAATTSIGAVYSF